MTLIRQATFSTDSQNTNYLIGLYFSKICGLFFLIKSSLLTALLHHHLRGWEISRIVWVEDGIKCSTNLC